MPAVDILDVGFSSVQGDRDSQEDRYLYTPVGTLKSRKEVAVFAVLDGHGGTEAVSHAHATLIDHLDAHLSSSPTPPLPEEYERAIQRALTAVDKDIDRLDLTGGCTVALALIDTKQGLLIEADLGDSHIVFASQDTTQEPRTSIEFRLSSDARSSTGGDADADAVDDEYNTEDATSEPGPDWTHTILSVEHSPAAPEEQARIEASGGTVNYSTGIARVGTVSMSRALGDSDFKRPRVNRLAGHDLSDLVGVGVETGVQPGKKVTSDLISNRAHFTQGGTEITGPSLLVLASDGVGDRTGAESAAREATLLYERGSSAEAIAQHLTQSAETTPGADNCTVVIVALDTLRRRHSRRDSASSSMGIGGFLKPSNELRKRAWSSSSSRSRRSSISSMLGGIRGLGREK